MNLAQIKVSVHAVSRQGRETLVHGQRTVRCTHLVGIHKEGGMSTAIAKRGIGPAMGWMVGLSILLSWIPLVGGLVAGFVGGRKAGNVPTALMAVFLPGVLLFVVTLFMGALIGWIPIIGRLWGAVASTGGWVLSFMNVIPLVIGAWIGGATAKR